MAETTPQLKRKRESLAGQQKKAKKRRQSDASAGRGTEGEAAHGTPVAQSTPRKEPPSRKSQGQSNGIHDNESSAAPSVVTKSNKLTKVEVADPGQFTVSKTTKSKKQNKNSAKWTISPIQGGWFLPTDPVFSSDEKYLLLATLKSLQVYTTETSLLARTLPVGGTGCVITAYALSSTKPNQVYVADSTGLITLWDWADGTKIGRWDIGATVRNMDVITQPGGDDDLVYCHETGDKDIINVHALRTKSHASKTELKRVLKSTSSIQNIQVLLQGKYIVIATANSITVGKRLKISKTAVQDFEYVWRELQFSKRITTFNTYFRPSEVTDKGKKSVQDQRDILDLAVGDEAGVILLFEDILASFAALESSQKGNKNKTDTAESLRPKRLHWHRDAIGAVKWSLDGNYLVSGGDETVLTIWQLSTGKPQHLPHLSAAIENVVVSPTGTSYALTLANNSVIVLSTTELEAKTNIIGVQSRRVDIEQMWKVSAAGRFPLDVFQPVPIEVDPKNDQMLLAVPSSQPRQKRDGLSPQPYLQTYDLASQRSGARQALTRNNATEPNMAPEGGRIIEPDVKLLQVSHDGEWLATVDEWLPPRADTTYLNEGIEEINEEERLLRREVYLKIWRWDEKKVQWALEARIDAPHSFEDVNGNGRVFDLIADPTEHGFATVGEDHVVRIWRPKTRLRDGIVVRGASDRGLVNWSLDRSVQLPRPLTFDPSTSLRLSSLTSRMAWSADGSVLVTAVSDGAESDSGLVHFIDPYGATIQRSMTEIDLSVLCGLGVVDRHLVIVTDCITVWDMVCDKPVYYASINTSGVDRFESSSLVRLATNESNDTFAISLPHFEKKESSRLKKATSKILVYSTTQQEPLWSHTTAGITLGLASRAKSGFVVLDSNSCLRTISPTAVGLQLPTPPPEEKIEIQRIVDVQETEDIQDDASRQEITVDAGYDRPVVTQQDLEKLFHNSDVLPPPKDMFSAVLSLFGGLKKSA